MKERIYGRNPVYEVLRAGKRDAFRLLLARGGQEKGRLAEIVNLCRKKKIAIEYVHRQQLDKVSSTHQGVVLEVNAFTYHPLDEMLALADQRGEAPFILILDTLQDPQNLGTLLRTAEIVGVHGVLLPLRQTATVTPAVVAASSGASEHIMVGQSNLAQAISILKQNEIWVIGLDGGPGSQPVDKVNLKGNLALVVGNEGQGMRQLVRKSCDILMSLPQRGELDSLNAGVAGSVSLYFAWQARGFTE